MKLTNATIRLMKAITKLPSSVISNEIREAYIDCQGIINTQKVKQNKCLMKNSGVTLEMVSEAFKEATDLRDADVKHYYDSAMDWSDGKGEMRKDWVATLRNFARKDIRDGKLKLSVHRTSSGTKQGTKFIPEPVSKTAVTYKEFKEGQEK